MPPELRKPRPSPRGFQFATFTEAEPMNRNTVSTFSPAQTDRISHAVDVGRAAQILRANGHEREACAVERALESLNFFRRLRGAA